MGKRKKKRTHIKEVEDESLTKQPNTFIFRRGKVGKTVKELVDDMRHVMLPNTALNLKESKSNNLRDFINVAGPYGVSHMMIFSATDLGTYMRILKSPRGPTLTFKVNEYSLIADIHNLQQRPHSPGIEYKVPPVLVLNNFGSEENHMKLMAITFQNMFPTININTINLNDCKRVVLINYDKETGMIEFRHYLIKVAQVGLSKSIKRVLQQRVSSLDKFSDISEYVLGGTDAAESDVEDGPESHVEVTKKTKKGQRVQQSAIKLQELGPRIKMQLVKIEDGVCDGAVLHHAIVKKSAEEVEALKARKDEEKKLKEERRREQEARVLAKGGKIKKRDDHDDDADDEDDEDSVYERPDDSASEKEDEAMADVDEDIEWYKREIGEDPTEEDLKAFKAARAKDNQKREKFHPTTFRKRKKGASDPDNGDQEPSAEQPPAKKQKVTETKSKPMGNNNNNAKPQQPKKGILKNTNNNKFNKRNSKK
jgi:ribosome biogenesis protein SSF1/2